jgi:lipopolysaccharide export LptBFGC system permease protein LptF
MGIMKKFISTIALFAILALPIAVVPVLLSTGCTTTAQQTAVVTEYQTLSGVVKLVDAARGAYDTLYKAGKVSQATDDKVLVAYTKYQSFANLAIKTARDQAAAVVAGTAPALALDNPYIVDLQNAVNGLIDIFNTTVPPAQPLTMHLSIAKNAKS